MILFAIGSSVFDVSKPVKASEFMWNWKSIFHENKDDAESETTNDSGTDDIEYEWTVDSVRNIAYFSPFDLENCLIPQISLNNNSIELAMQPIYDPKHRLLNKISSISSISFVKIDNNIFDPFGVEYMKKHKFVNLPFYSTQTQRVQLSRNTNQTIENNFKIDKHHTLFETFKNERPDSYSIKYTKYYPAIVSRYISQMGYDLYKQKKKDQRCIDSTNKIFLTNIDHMLHNLFDSFLSKNPHLKMSGNRINHTQIVTMYESWIVSTEYKAQLLDRNVKAMHKKAHVNNRAKFVLAITSFLKEHSK